MARQKIVLWSVKSKVEFFSEIMATVFLQTTAFFALVHIALATGTLRRSTFDMHIPACNTEKKKKIHVYQGWTV